MSKTCKKLLASALAAAMLITTFVSSFVVSAATTGTLTIKDTTITVGAEEAVVNFKLAFDAFVEAPHELATITANPALTIKDIALGDVTYETAPVDPEDPEIESPALKIKTDGINKNAGKVLFESGVDGAVKASEINFTVTFDTTEAAVGTYTVSAAIASTDINEADIVVNCDDTGAIVVEEQKPVEPECEHVNLTFVSATPATATELGKLVYTCDDCSEPVEKDVNYNAGNTVASFSAACESEILLQFDVWSSLFVAQSDVSTTMLVIEKEDYTDGTVSTVTEVLYTDDATEFVKNDAPAFRWTYGVAAKMLSDNCKATVYCEANGVWYSGIVMTKKFTDYAVNSILSKSDTAVKPQMKTVVVDMLNYGAAAQETFGYNTANLANAGIDAYQSYATQENPEAVSVLDRQFTAAAGYFIPYSYSLMAESNIQIRYAFMPYSFTPNADDVKITFEYTNSQGEAKSYEFYSYDKLLAEGNTAKIDAGEYFTISGGNYYADLATLAAADCDSVITAKIYNGEDCHVTLVYSVASAIAKSREDNVASLNTLNALYKYCKSAYTLFANAE